MHHSDAKPQHALPISYVKQGSVVLPDFSRVIQISATDCVKKIKFLVAALGIFHRLAYMQRKSIDRSMKVEFSKRTEFIFNFILINERWLFFDSLRRQIEDEFLCENVSFVSFSFFLYKVKNWSINCEELDRLIFFFFIRFTLRSLISRLMNFLQYFFLRLTYYD